MTTITAEAEFTLDTLLGGKLKLIQPVNGLRAAIDPVFLAASVPITPNQSVLELGCGSGAAFLGLLHRQPEAWVTAIELQPELAELARRNAAENGFQDRVRIINGDIASIGDAIEPYSFHHVMANPPYLVGRNATPPPDDGRKLAVCEGAADLAVWIKAAWGAVRPKGSVTLIHRADRLDALLRSLPKDAGDIRVLPLWPKQGMAARRVIVACRRQRASPFRLLPGLVLHEIEGNYTAEAEAILRHGQALAMN